MPIATYQELVKDCRKVLKEIRGDNHLYTISINHKGSIYNIFYISIFSDEEDIDKKYITATSREFKDNTAFYIHFVRDTLANLVITIHGKPKWIIEPCRDTSKYLMKRLNISSLDELSDIFLGGDIKKIIDGVTNKIRCKANKKIKSLESKFDEDLKIERSDKHRMNDALYTQKTEIDRLKDNVKYWQKRVRLLEDREGTAIIVNSPT